MSLSSHRSRALLPPCTRESWSLWCIMGLLSFFIAALMITTVVGGQMAGEISKRLHGSMAVLVRGRGLESDTAAVARATEILGSMNGVTGATPLEPDGTGRLVANLITGRPQLINDPLAHLLVVSIAPRVSPDAATMARRLSEEGIEAQVDVQSPWTSHLWRTMAVASGLVLAAWLSLALIASMLLRSTIRRYTAINREIITLLHLSGASDGFISGLFRRRLGAYAAAAAGAGVLLAIIVAIAWRLLVQPGFAWTTLAAALPWPIIASVAAMTAATVSTRAVLKNGT